MPEPRRVTAARALHVDSEVGALRRVLLHRPRLAKDEHDAFAAALVDRGVVVLYLRDVLDETMEDDIAREWLINRIVRGDDHGRFLGPELAKHLYSLSPTDLAEAIIGGVARGDLLFRVKGLRYVAMGADDSVLPPLPNQRFMRDTSTWAYDGVAVHSLSDPARRRETLILAAVYRFHPMFEDGPFHLWYDGADATEPRAAVQGGDLHVVGSGTVLIGFGGFTSAQAVERLATAMFAAGSVREVLAIQLPSRRPGHLDARLSMVDRATLCAGVGVDLLRCWSLRPTDTPGALDVYLTDGVLPSLARTRGVDALRVVTGSDFGNDVLAIAPGVVVSYEHNVDTNVELRRGGVDVITVSGRVLGPAHGGPRRVVCPIERDAVR